MSRLPTALALSASGWETALISALATPPGAVGTIRRCVDVVDLLAEVGAGLAGAVVLDPDFPRLDVTVVARLRAASVPVIGVSADEAGEQRLRQWGITALVTVDPQQPTLAVDSIAQALARSGLTSLMAPTLAAGRGQASIPTALTGAGTLIVVWGPVGAPGRTSIAIGMAERLAAQGTDSMVVDADLQAAGVADLLGMTSDVSGLIAACRQAEQGTLDVASLARVARALSPKLRVLTGLPHPNRRSELRPAALRSVWSTSRMLTACTIVDVGSSVDPEDDVYGAFDENFDTLGTPTSCALADADVVVAVAGCEPQSVSRLLSRADQIQAINPNAPLHIVINKVRGSVVGSRALTELSELIASRLNPIAIWTVPDDRDASDSAARKGQTLFEYAPQSKASCAITELSTAIYRGTVAATVDVRAVG